MGFNDCCIFQTWYELDALSRFNEMLHHWAYQPNEFIFGSVFSACSSLLHHECGRQIHGICIKFGLGRDIFAGCSLCDMYAQCGLLDSARIVFNDIESPDLASWNAIIAGVARAGCMHEADDFINQMAFDADIVEWKSLLAYCKTHGNVDVGKRAAENILKIDPTNSATLVLLCNIYASSGKWEEVAM